MVNWCRPSIGAGTVAENGDVHGSGTALSSLQANSTLNAGSSGSTPENWKVAELADVITGGPEPKLSCGGVPST